MFAGAVAGLTAVCYAELAGAVPVSGSSYSYAYATLGELVAVGVAACLLLEYGVSGAAVAVGWSQYLNQFLGNVFGVEIPENLSQCARGRAASSTCPAVVLHRAVRAAPHSRRERVGQGQPGHGAIKVGVLFLFVGLGVHGWNSDNLSDFAPFGINGITSAAGIIFFSYIGLDAVSTAGEEGENPRRNLPLAIIFSLMMVTGSTWRSPRSRSPRSRGGVGGPGGGPVGDPRDMTGSTWPATVIAAGAVISIFSVTLVVIYGQTRILFAMGRDGMFPRSSTGSTRAR